MIERQTLLAYLEELLSPAQGEDVCPNGLQVEGAEEIHKLVTGVSACEELFQKAAEEGAEAVLVHHGIFWRGEPSPLVGHQYRRVATLIRHEINLFAYHLPLDRHPEVGNNAVAARRLGLEDLEAFGHFGGQAIGVAGRLPAPVPLGALLEELEGLFDRKPMTFPYGPGEISTLAIISGGGGSCLREAIERRLDLFLTGEAEEWTMNLAKEARIHYVAAGHYATERLGVQAIGERLRDRFDLEVEFVDIPNPV